MLAALGFLRYLPALVFWLALHVWVGRRMMRPLGWSRPRRIGSWLLIAAIALYPMIALSLPRLSPEHPAERAVVFSGMLVFGFASIVLALTAGIAAVQTVLRPIQWLVARRRPAVTPEPEPDLERRNFFSNVMHAGVLTTAGTVTAAGVRGALRLPDVKRVDVTIAGLDPRLEGLTIAHLSDIHIGPTIRSDYLRGLVDQVNELEVDLVAVTGDVVDGLVEHLSPQLAPLSDLRSTHGTFAVTGNHEYYWRGEQWVEFFDQGLGMRVLGNRHEVLEHQGARFTLAGVHDLHAARHVPAHASDPQRAAEGAPDGLRILLAHQPRSAPAAAETNAFDLQLSGHTHGGQYAPFPIMVWLAQPYLAGLHRVSERMQIYVSRGCGYWGPPIRAGAPSEIAVLRLTGGSVA